MATLTAAAECVKKTWASQPFWEGGQRSGLLGVAFLFPDRWPSWKYCGADDRERQREGILTRSAYVHLSISISHACRPTSRSHTATHASTVKATEKICNQEIVVSLVFISQVRRTVRRNGESQRGERTIGHAQGKPMPCTTAVTIPAATTTTATHDPPYPPQEEETQQEPTQARNKK